MDRNAAEYIDLTMLLNEDVPVYPNHPKPMIKQQAALQKDGWNEKECTFSSHHGTHIDFPSHMIDKGKTQNDYEIGKFIGDGKIFDVRNKKEICETLKDVREGDIVLFCTGRSKFAGDFQKYCHEAPVMTEGFADELVNKKIKLVGIDTWSVDQGKPFFIHKKLLSNDILIVENLTNLEKLIGKTCKIYVNPLRLDGFDGSPCRVFAEITANP